jgi:ATP-dependent Lon protease
MFDNLKITTEDDWEDDSDMQMPDFPVFPIDLSDDAEEEAIDYNGTYPAIALRNTVLYPGFIAPVGMNREKSVKAIKHAYENGGLVAVFAQKDSDDDDPKASEIYELGTLAFIGKVFDMPDGTTTALLHGKRRVLLKKMTQQKPFFKAKVEQQRDEKAKSEKKMEVIMGMIREKSHKIIRLSPNIPDDAVRMIDNIDSYTFLLHFIAANLSIKVAEKQRLLEIGNLFDRAQAVYELMNEEMLALELREELDAKTRTELDKHQREYQLQQHLKTIQDELGEQTPAQETQDLEVRAAAKKWSAATAAQFEKELKKMRRMNPMQPDYGMQLNYLEAVLELPWGEYSQDNFDLKKAKAILDKEHFGLEKIKERILEHLAILKLKGDLKAPILCLVGPPGVGKTSLGQSIANALERKYQRIALGGLHDESEIRGHRRTYMGALPGRIIQALRRAGTDNPVIVLDEIDKIGRDMRGDPQNALLEVLDPEQNSTFHDNFLDMDYDLSKVLFIATANTLEGIQAALLDRMEIISLSGYTIEEKQEIAKRHLLPKEIDAHGLKPTNLKLKPATIDSIIQHFTREAGVRELDRRLASICRAIAKKVAMEETYAPTLSYPNVLEILGPEHYDDEIYAVNNMPGVAVGLAWTSVGGDILYIESSLSKGKGGLTLTGNLGDVMKESATTALSFLKANATKLGIDEDVFEQKNIHIHVPEGAIPKDGPSAGITMLSALASSFYGRPLKNHLAMTGEITLRGKVLPVGGIKEKILAAKRSGITTIILCKANERHIKDIPANYIDGLTFHYVERMEEVLDLALVNV